MCQCEDQMMLIKLLRTFSNIWVHMQLEHTTIDKIRLAKLFSVSIGSCQIFQQSVITPK